MVNDGFNGFFRVMIILSVLMVGIFGYWIGQGMQVKALTENDSGWYWDIPASNSSLLVGHPSCGVYIVR